MKNTLYLYFFEILMRLEYVLFEQPYLKQNIIPSILYSS